LPLLCVERERERERERESPPYIEEIDLSKSPRGGILNSINKSHSLIRSNIACSNLAYDY